MADLRAGFARRDITQPLGTPSSLGLNVPVEEIWDPLTATACVVEAGGERFAIVGMDLCGLLAASHTAIREAVAAATEGAIPADRVVVNASHSHSAPYLSDELQELLRPFGLRLQDEDQDQRDHAGGYYTGRARAPISGKTARKAAKKMDEDPLRRYVEGVYKASRFHTIQHRRKNPGRAPHFPLRNLQVFNGDFR